MSAPPIPPIYRSTNLLPWVEVNYEAGTYVASAITGLKAWRPYCQKVIVSTMSGKIGIYRQLLPVLDLPAVNEDGVPLPPIKIIPGSNSLGVLNHLGDVGGWKKLSTQVLPMLSACGETTFIWELETIMQRELERMAAGYPFNRKGLISGLQYLPQGTTAGLPITYLLYPAIAGRHQLYRTNSTIWKAVLGPRVRFIDHTFYRELSHNDVHGREFLTQLDGRPPTPLIYFRDVPVWWSWLYVDAPEAIRRTGYAPEVIVYPGWVNFPPSAPAIGKALWP